MPSEEERGAEVRPFLEQQNELLQKIATHLAPEEEENRLRKLNRLLVKSISYAAIFFGGVVALWEVTAYLFETWKIENLAANYANVGVALYYKENNSTVASKFINKAIELVPNNPKYRQISAFIDGMAAVRLLFNLDRPYTAEELNQTHEALAKSILLQQVDPKGAEAFILRGQIYTALKDHSRASEALDKALEIDPKNSFAWVRKAVVEYNSDNKEQAILALDKAAEIDPESKWVFLWRGIFASDGKKPKEARAHFTEALRVDPRFDLAFYNLAWTYLSVRPRDYEKAEKNMNKALSVNPAYKEAYYGLGMIYGYQNKYEVAHSYLTRAVEIDSKFLTGWKWRGIVNDEMGHRSEARSDFSAAIKLDPSNGDLYTRRARVLINDKAYEEALKDYF